MLITMLFSCCNVNIMLCVVTMTVNKQRKFKFFSEYATTAASISNTSNIIQHINGMQ